MVDIFALTEPAFLIVTSILSEVTLDVATIVEPTLMTEPFLIVLSPVPSVASIVSVTSKLSVAAIGYVDPVFKTELAFSMEAS